MARRDAILVLLGELDGTGLHSELDGLDTTACCRVHCMFFWLRMAAIAATVIGPHTVNLKYC